MNFLWCTMWPVEERHLTDRQQCHAEEAGMSDPIRAAVTLSGAHSLGNIRSTMPHDSASGEPLFTFQANLKSHIPSAQMLARLLSTYVIKKRGRSNRSKCLWRKGDSLDIART